MLRIQTIFLTVLLMLGSPGFADEELSPEHQILQEKLASASHCLGIMVLEGSFSVKLEFEVDATFYSEAATKRRSDKMLRLAMQEFDVYAERFFDSPRKSQYFVTKWRDNWTKTWGHRNFSRLMRAALQGDFKEVDTTIKKCVEVYELDAPENDLLFDFDNAEIIKPTSG